MAHATRMSDADTGLLVIDVQEKLLPAIPDAVNLVRNIEFLLDVASLAGMPVRATEQYPQGLGPTVAALAAKLPAARPAKVSFSCCGAAGLVESLDRPSRPWVVLVGMETHVCVSQTALDLFAAGFRVVVPVDAVSARFRLDHEVALDRLRDLGATITTAEATAFEWFGGADHPQFKAFSKLVQARALAIRDTHA